MKGHGICEMHMSLIVGKKWSMHKIVQNHSKLSFGFGPLAIMQGFWGPYTKTTTESLSAINIYIILIMA